MNKYLIAIALLILLIGVAWFFIGSNSQPQQSATNDTPTSMQFDIVVKNRKVEGGDALLSVRQNDVVTITITANESDELHLHGYDKSVDFATNTPVTLTFTADKTGHFPFEMEGSKTDLGAVDVLP